VSWKANLVEGGVLVESPGIAAGGIASGQHVIVSAGDLPPGISRNSRCWGIAYFHWTKGAATKAAILDGGGNVVLQEFDSNILIDREVVASITPNSSLVISATGSGSAFTMRAVPINRTLQFKQL